MWRPSIVAVTVAACIATYWARSTCFMPAGLTLTLLSRADYHQPTMVQWQRQSPMPSLLTLHMAARRFRD
jgi:hypothetical protein